MPRSTRRFPLCLLSVFVFVFAVIFACAIAVAIAVVIAVAIAVVLILFYVVFIFRCVSVVVFLSLDAKVVCCRVCKD